MRLTRMNGEGLIAFLDARRKVNDREGKSTSSEVSAILGEIARDGLDAVKRYTEKFDGVRSDDFLVSEKALEQAWNMAERDWCEAMGKAAVEISSYHIRQKETGFEDRNESGVVRGMRVLPMERVGLYVPGGRAAYPSTLLMNAIPAQLAGVKELVVFSPPDENGLMNPSVMAAAYMLGIRECYAIGGVQAVGVAAYGVEGIRPVDKLVGPGNAYVAEAKRQVFGRIGIDMVAGPSEVLVIATEDSIPEYVAMDLMAQAEHDPDACAVLLTPSSAFADKVEEALNLLVPGMERSGIIRRSIEKNGICVIAKDLEEAFELSNAYAPEHLELCYPDAMKDLERITAAGSVFLGPWTPEATGDYVTGTNHTLPTMGTARFQSPLGVYDFVKRMAYAVYSKDALEACSRTIKTIAESEGLEAHWRSVDIRLEKRQSSSSVSRLNANENPYPVRLDDLFGGDGGLGTVDLNRYPDPQYPELRNLMSEWISTVLTPMDATNVVCGNGSDECIRMVYDAVLGPSDTVLAIGRTFGEYGTIARSKGVVFNEVGCLDEPEPDLKSILDMVVNISPRLLIICNPNNPTGFKWPKSWVDRILEAFGGYVLVDEAYGEFIDDSIADCVRGDSRLIVIRTLSKAAGLAGVRFGYVMAQESTAMKIDAVRMPYNINVLTLAVVERYLKNLTKKQASSEKTMENFRNQVRELSERVNRLYGVVVESGMAASGDVIPYRPNANFLFMKVRKGIENRFIVALEAKKVRIRVFPANEDEAYTCMRISAGLEDEMKAVEDVIREVMAC